MKKENFKSLQIVQDTINKYIALEGAIRQPELNKISELLQVISETEEEQETGKKFPNGFANWMETHHLVVAYIESELSYPASKISRLYAVKGTGRMFELAEEWTDLFEKTYEGKEWDGEYFDTLDAFLIEQHNAL
jgi:hypothetical protein